MGLVIARATTDKIAIPNGESVPALRVSPSLDDLALRLARESNTRELLHAAAEWLNSGERGGNGFPLVVIYRYDPATHELIDPVVVGREVPDLAPRLRLGAGMFGDVAQSRTPYYVERISREPRFGATARDMHTAYFVPLLEPQSSGLIGVLCVQSDKPGALGEDEQASLRQVSALISAQASTALRLENSEQVIKRFEQFQKLAQRLTDRLESAELFNEIAATAGEMLGTAMSVLLDIAPDGDEMRHIAWSGISDGSAAVLRSRYKEDLKGMVGWARLPARTPDLRTDQRTALASQAVVVGMLSELAVPVLHFDKLYGVLAVETDSHRHFTDEESRLLSALASHAGIALRNAQLFERLQHTNRQLEKTVADLVISRQQAENTRLAAVSANQLKSEFVNNMSHELRTPLNAVINFTRIVRDGLAGAVNDEQVQYLGYVHDSGQHLLGLIHDILDLAKIEAGKMDLRREATPARPILQHS